MTELLVGTLAGGGISWLLTHVYYRKSSIEVPEWAKPIIRNLPPERPSRERLLELFQEALEKGDVRPDPVFGHVACPECHAPFSDMNTTTRDADRGRVVAFADCPHCGWSAHAEF